MHDPDIFGFAWLMLVRTRFIDELMDARDPQRRDAVGDPGRRIRYAGPPLQPNS